MGYRGRATKKYFDEMLATSKRDLFQNSEMHYPKRKEVSPTNVKDKLSTICENMVERLFRRNGSSLCE